MRRIQKLNVYSDDDFVSLRDQLMRSSADRVVILIPRANKILEQGIELVLLKRFAQANKLEIGIVPGNRRMANIAKSANIPTFRSFEDARRQERVWRAHRHLSPEIGLSERDTSSLLPQSATKSKSQLDRFVPATWRVWLLRYSVILTLFILSAFLFVGIVYTIPGATVTLRPKQEELIITKTLVADPAQADINFEAGIIPARQLKIPVTWQAEKETSGVLDIAVLPASGEIVFINRLDQPVTVPAGTLVKTVAGPDSNVEIGFQTTRDVDIPGIVGGTAAVDIIALEPGPSGNLNAGSITVLDDNLSIQLDIELPEPTSGGGTRPVSIVSEADIEALRAEATRFMIGLALTRASNQLSDSEIFPEAGITLDSITLESYSHQVGDRSDTVSIRIEATMAGVAIDTIQATDIVYTELVQAVSPGQQLNPASFQFSTTDQITVTEDRIIHFDMQALGTVSSNLDLETSQLFEEIAGQEIELAMAYLEENLILESVPTARVVPDWLGRMPYQAERIVPIIVNE